MDRELYVLTMRDGYYASDLVLSTDGGPEGDIAACAKRRLPQGFFYFLPRHLSYALPLYLLDDAGERRAAFWLIFSDMNDMAQWTFLPDEEVDAMCATRFTSADYHLFFLQKSWEDSSENLATFPVHLRILAQVMALQDLCNGDKARYYRFSAISGETTDGMVTDFELESEVVEFADTSRLSLTCDGPMVVLEAAERLTAMADDNMTTLNPEHYAHDFHGRA